jgi:hypothetical protein
MSCPSKSPTRASRLGAVAAGLLVFFAACNDESSGPTPVAETPAAPIATIDTDTVATDVLGADTLATGVLGSDTVTTGVLDAQANQAGIVFGTFNMPNSYLDNVHTGWMNGGPLDPSNILSNLSGARAKGARVVIKLCKGKDSFVKNGDGTFSLTKWKALVSQYRSVDLGPYISDGTIIGHYLIDEPQRASRWGGQVISQATLEDMAQYSKELWPQMATLVRVVPSWLASASVSYKYLDAGWTQYTAGKGDPGKWAASEASAARRKGLGMVVGINVIDGGNGSSRIRGVTGGKWSMSASEIRSYGNALLSESYACAFFNWQHNTSYYGRSDIKSAMADVSAKARSHPKTSCKQ